MKIILLLSALFSMISLGVSAQETKNVTDENVTELIETLESETARTEFIENLKTLQETKAEEDTVESGLNLDVITGGAVDAYEDFLISMGLNEDFFGQIIATFAVIVAGLIFTWIVKKLSHFLRDRLTIIRDRYHLRHDRFRLYARGIRYIGYVIVTFFTLYSIGIIWNIADSSFIIGDGSRIFLINTFNIFLVIFIAITLWEVINTTIENYLGALDGPNSARMRTIMPIVKNVLLVAFAILFVLVLLSEIGINIVPLLAGAGVLGIAIGFGAQTMVKDFLTGFTIIFEDLIQVGDVAKLGDRVGLVEKITIRKVQLRDLSGIVYTVPFSEITIVENWTKDFSYYIFDVGIAYREDVDEVIGYLKDIDQDMREDDGFKNLILEPLEVLGVDKFADSAVVIKARIKTLPIKQWEVGREFNRRMKYKFDEHNVEIPFPHQTLYFGHDKKGQAPAAPVELLNTNNSNKD
jgi:small conductance mechanosensitive channel